MLMSSRVKAHVEFVKAADDANYLWLKLKKNVLGCPDVYFCACYMPPKKDFKEHLKNMPTAICLYKCLTL